MTITISQPAPVPSGTFITICVEPPPPLVGTVTVNFKCSPGSATPQSLDFTAESPCTKFYIPECDTLIAQCPGHQDVAIR